MQVQVRINEEGALRNQRYAFSNRYTLLTELLQNARRAGATRIQVHYAPATRVLRVIDDGHGITDFQKLLTFNESGWEDDTADKEHAFGVGFSKCLYSAQRCIVRSCGHCIDFLTADALRRKPIEVASLQDNGFTTVELHGVDLPDLRSRVEHLCCGFPLPVSYNGSELSRPYANLPQAVTTDIGRVALIGTQNGEFSSSTVVFLQGFCVAEPHWLHPRHVNVVHLDPARFIARLPDRDQLIDADEQLQQVECCLRALWRDILLQARQRLGEEAFVELYYDCLRGWGHLDLLDDLQVLPRRLCSHIDDYPVQEFYGDNSCLVTVEQPLPRSAVERGAVVVVSQDSVNADNAACWMLSRALGHIDVATAGLGKQHWIHEHLLYLAPRELQVEVVGEQYRTLFEGRHVCIEVVLCEEVCLHHGFLQASITADAVYHDGVAYIPAQAGGGDVLRQASAYLDGNEQFMDLVYEEDSGQLAELIQRLRLRDPVTALESLLRGLKLEKYPLLQNHAFRLLVTGHGQPPQLDLLA